ncbi:MAG: insulinase family protein [Armatimonadetes bacterium]|nr:insulinase family protein [Armatimonadota bacterium]
MLAPSAPKITAHLAVFALCALLFVWSATPALAQQPYERTLSNGLTIVVAPDPSLRLVSVDVWVRAGSAFENDDEQGVAHFLEHVIFKGTPTRGPGEIDLAIENVGATLNAATSKDWAHFFTTIATEYLDTALDLLSDAVLHPVFRPAEVAREAQVIASEIAGRRSDPVQLLQDSLAENLFGSHPYGRPVYGTLEQVRSISPQQLASFHKRCYVGPAMTVVVVGNVTPDDIFKRVEKRFSSVPDGTPAAWPPKATPPTQATPVDIPEKSAGAQWLGVSFLGPSMDDPSDVWTMDVLASILARKESGCLYDRLVTADNVSVGVGANFLTQKLPAMVSLVTGALPGKEDENLAAIRQEIAKIRLDGASADEMAAAKRYLLGTNAFETETASGQASSLGFYAVIGSVRDSVHYAENVQKVTLEDVQRVARKYLDPSHMVVVRLSK